jgi:hypothetical protein
MEIKIKEISKEILEIEHCYDETNGNLWDDFVMLCEEANAVNALDFFEIEYDSENLTLTIPDDFDAKRAMEIVEAYFEYQEHGGEQPYKTADISDEIAEQAELYDEHTEGSRGADDGTFDYAGTYVISILSIIEEVQKQNKEAN